MKNTILTILAVFTFLMSYAQPKAQQVKEEPKVPDYFCVQILSTQNPQAIKRADVDLLGETLHVEQVTINEITYHRVMLVYKDFISAKSALSVIYNSGFKLSLLCGRSQEQIDKMYPLFSDEKVKLL